MEIYLDDRVIVLDEIALRKAQAAWRGAVVRMRMKTLKMTFEEIFHAIEDDSSKDPWSSGYLQKIWTENAALWKPHKNLITAKLIQDSDVLDTDVKHVNNNRLCAVEGKHLLVISDATNDDNPTAGSSVCKTELNVTDKMVEVSSVEQNLLVNNFERPVTDNKMSQVFEDDPSKLGNETSVWESLEVASEEYSNVDTEEQRKQIVMELLWIQQAINSRKQYLQMKKQMS